MLGPAAGSQHDLLPYTHDHHLQSIGNLAAKIHHKPSDLQARLTVDKANHPLIARNRTNATNKTPKPTVA